MSASHAMIAAGYISMAEQELEQDLASTMKTILDREPNIAHRALVFVLQDECLVTFEKADSYIKSHREV
jgi:hypothetical protein